MKEPMTVLEALEDIASQLDQLVSDNRFDAECVREELTEMIAKTLAKAIESGAEL